LLKETLNSPELPLQTDSNKQNSRFQLETKNIKTWWFSQVVRY